MAGTRSEAPDMGIGVSTEIKPAPPEKPTKPKLGRPITLRIKLGATPEEVAQAMFAAARPGANV